MLFLECLDPATLLIGSGTGLEGGVIGFGFMSFIQLIAPSI